MFKPANWDDIPPQYYGDRRPEPPPGAYVCKIVSASTSRSSTSGNEMAVLDLDIAEGKFKDWCQSESDRAAELGWEPRWKLKLYQGYQGENLPFFKGLITNIEVSNPNFKFDFEIPHLTGKLVGVVLDAEEYEYNGDTRRRLKPGRTYTVEQVRQGQTRPPMRIGLDKKRHRLGAPTAETTNTTKIDEKPELEIVDEVDIPF